MNIELLFFNYFKGAINEKLMKWRNEVPFPLFQN